MMFVISVLPTPISMDHCPAVRIAGRRVSMVRDPRLIRTQPAVVAAALDASTTGAHPSIAVERRR